MQWHVQQTSSYLFIYLRKTNNDFIFYCTIFQKELNIGNFFKIIGKLLFNFFHIHTLKFENFMV
jgi:hypothetical protein